MNTYIKIGAFLGMLAVILGAFGAHGLEKILSANQIDTFETGVRYHFYHTFALLIACLLSSKHPTKLLLWAARCFIIGILLFSGSIYLLACREVLGIESWWFLGPLTPIGGTFFIIGWILVFLNVFKEDNYKR